jgi:hypothetical protein
MRSRSILLACAFTFLAGAHLAVARLNAPDYSELWKRAEVVVVAVAVNSEETGAQLRVPVNGVYYLPPRKRHAEGKAEGHTSARTQ